MPQRIIKYFGLFVSVISFSLLLISLIPPKVKSIDNPPLPESVIDEPLETIAEAKEFDTDAYFSIVIPKLGLSAKITPNLNPLKEEDYTDALKEGIAHASTSFYPGQNNSIFLFAHNSDLFYHLKDLDAGDEIILFYHYQKYFYEVAETTIVEPDDLTVLIPAHTEKLILQTCYPPGTRQKRLLVIGYPIDSH